MMTHIQNIQQSEIHLVFKTHLDIGFTALARDVVARYFDHFIPLALKTADSFRREESQDQFIWTTGSWLIYEYLEQASSSDRARMEAGIEAGSICWHGLPFTTHSEFMDASLFEYGLSLSQELDSRFGKHTIAAKMTDVPGHSKAIVPLLAHHGIEFLHIGVNSVCTPPDVPPIFVWRTEDGSELIVMYHDNYGGMMSIEGASLFLSYASDESGEQDNLGPHSESQIRNIYEDLRHQFPAAQVCASTLDNFAQKLRAIKKELPVIEQEIGDTWIHGIASDPVKTARFREMTRLRRRWHPQIPSEKQAFREFSHALMLVPEHTWGLDMKKHLQDFRQYGREDFLQARQSAPFQKMEESWTEQRNYIEQALTALKGSTYQEQAFRELAALQPAQPSTEGFEEVTDPHRVFRSETFDIGFHHAAISHLVHRATGQVLATDTQPLSVLHYQSFSQKDYDRFLAQYHTHTTDWAIPDFSKPGIDRATPESIQWHPESVRLFSRETASGHHFILNLHMPSEASEKYGCPPTVFIEVALLHTGVIHFTVQWTEKPATRLPEAIWYALAPAVPHPERWRMDKMGLPISPLEVVSKGNRSLHAIDKGLHYADEQYHVSVDSLDAPLVAPGTPSLLRFDTTQPALEKGFQFNLYNNVWGTNFPLWFGEGAKFRFLLHMRTHEPPSK